MKVFKTWSNSKPSEGQKFTMPSQTTPDQTMSMKTILERYAKGLPVADGKEPIWDEDPENSAGINPRTLDLVDLQEMGLKNAERIKDLTNKKSLEDAEAINKKKEERESKKKEMLDTIKSLMGKKDADEEAAQH